jgi:short subunit dehydrogenase-like uncharacterized protein
MAATSKAITDEEIEAIIAPIAGGMTLMQSCKKARKDYININKRINASPELKQLYAHAREEYARTGAQRIHEIARNTKLDPATRRMMIDAIKWEISRILPKEFGDRVQQEVIITNNTTLSQRMASARARVRQKSTEQAIATQLPPETE